MPKKSITSDADIAFVRRLRETPSAHIISDEPADVRLKMTEKGGKVKLSSACRKITWSTGTVTYKCVLCDYERTNRNALAGHNKVHSQEERDTRTEYKPFIDPYIKWTPERRSELKLMAEINEALMAGLTNAADIAKFIVEHRPIREEKEEGERYIPPRTDSEKLDFIRRILDEGKTSELEKVIEAKNESIKSLEEKLENLYAKVGTVNKENKDLNSSISFLQDKVREGDLEVTKVNGELSAALELLDSSEKEIETRDNALASLSAELETLKIKFEGREESNKRLKEENKVLNSKVSKINSLVSGLLKSV